MTAKIVIIGIDAMDKELVSRFEDQLPNIRKLKNSGKSIKLNSVTPPDSDTAWATIYTGLNPAQHGIVQYVDPLEKSVSYVAKDIDNHPIKGKTFWDIASEAGKKVCVLTPHIGYPVWAVNGVMVARSSIEDNVDSFPKDFRANIDLASLNVPKGMPGKRLGEYKRKNEELLDSQGKLFLEMLERDDWDLFFVYTSVLDMVKHYFWNMYDETDPSYPGKNEFQDVIKDFYILHDQMVGKIMEKAKGATLILLSDHGHGMRPVRVLNVNELLRQKGYLILKDKGIDKSVSVITDKIKGTALSVVSKFGLGTLASKMLKLMPWAKRLYTSPLAIDWEKTVAFATNLSGIKAYSYSGIAINKDNLNHLDYEEVRQNIITELSSLLDSSTNQPYVKWIKCREDMYSGPYLEKYPDIVFELHYGLGVGLTANNELMGKSNSHHLVPGSHRSDTAVFYMSGQEKEIKNTELDLIDVAPTILDCLGLEIPPWVEGESIFS